MNANDMEKGSDWGERFSPAGDYLLALKELLGSGSMAAEAAKRHPYAEMSKALGSKDPMELARKAAGMAGSEECQEMASQGIDPDSMTFEEFLSEIK